MNKDYMYCVYKKTHYTEYGEVTFCEYKMRNIAPHTCKTCNKIDTFDIVYKNLPRIHD